MTRVPVVLRIGFYGVIALMLAMLFFVLHIEFGDTRASLNKSPLFLTAGAILFLFQPGLMIAFLVKTRRLDPSVQESIPSMLDQPDGATVRHAPRLLGLVLCILFGLEFILFSLGTWDLLSRRQEYVTPDLNGQLLFDLQLGLMLLANILVVLAAFFVVHFLKRSAHDLA